jgi:hypothetical protein
VKCGHGAAERDVFFDRGQITLEDIRVRIHIGEREETAWSRQKSETCELSEARIRNMARTKNRERSDYCSVHVVS